MRMAAHETVCDMCAYACMRCVMCARGIAVCHIKALYDALNVRLLINSDSTTFLVTCESHAERPVEVPVIG